MKRLFLLLSICFYSASSIALLPPFYQSSKEITAILADPTVIEKIDSGRPLKSIVKTDAGYTITAGECTLNVIITYFPPAKGIVGPAKFKIVTENLECEDLPKD